MKGQLLIFVIDALIHTVKPVINLAYQTPVKLIGIWLKLLRIRLCAYLAKKKDAHFVLKANAKLANKDSNCKMEYAKTVLMSFHDVGVVIQTEDAMNELLTLNFLILI